MFLALIKSVSDNWVIESFCRVIPMRSCVANGQAGREGLTVVKIPPEEGVMTPILRRNCKINLLYGVNISPG